MRFWFDTEFIDDGRTIELISIGLVSEDGREYYAENADCDIGRASAWVAENVIPHLTGSRKRHAQIAEDIVEFVGVNPEFWAYYGAYDWVVLCQLYGPMVELPASWPYYCRDLKQLSVHCGDLILPQQKGIRHHALADAIWTKKAWHFCADRIPEGMVL